MSKYDEGSSPEQEAAEQMEVEKILSRPENSAVQEFCEKENSDWVGKDKQLMNDVIKRAMEDDDVLRALKYNLKLIKNDNDEDGEKFRQYDILGDLLFEDFTDGAINRDFERVSKPEEKNN